MNESVIYRTLTKYCVNTMFQRVENEVNLGTPDIYFACKNGCGWIEAKSIPVPSRINTKIKVPFRGGQYAWLVDNFKHGGRSILAMLYDGKIRFAEGELIKLEYTQKEILALPYLELKNMYIDGL